MKTQKPKSIDSVKRVEKPTKRYSWKGLVVSGDFEWIGVNLIELKQNGTHHTD